MKRPSEDAFCEFIERTEPQLHRALVAKLGWETGREATAEALAFAWEHWAKVTKMHNPTGYLYRVGTSRVRQRRFGIPFVPQDDRSHWFEPSLGPSLAALSERQRIAVILVHGYGWTAQEVAEMTGIKTSTVQSHVERGLAHLREQLKVEDPNHA
jgi:DNA-directed RNA polymerase specialized sigma24 family protein